MIADLDKILPPRGRWLVERDGGVPPPPAKRELAKGDTPPSRSAAHLPLQGSIDISHEAAITTEPVEIVSGAEAL